MAPTSSCRTPPPPCPVKIPGLAKIYAFGTSLEIIFCKSMNNYVYCRIYVMTNFQKYGARVLLFLIYSSCFAYLICHNVFRRVKEDADTVNISRGI
jgi:hypothetical protein